MAKQTLHAEESLGLIWAVALHCALGLALVLFRPSAAIPPKEGVMTVTLSDDFGPEAATPNPTPEFRPDTAPELGEVPPPPVLETVPLARPTPPPRPVARPTPRPTAQPTTRPTARPTQRATPNPTRTPRPNQTGRPGGERVDGDFLEGLEGPARPSAQQRASFQSSVEAEVRPFWNRCPPSGLDAERLRVTLSFSLTREGAIQSMGTPRTRGVTDSNRRQVQRFEECARNAIRRAAPFRLPPEYFESWRSREITFSIGELE